jgi:hypothetical protein
VQRDSDSTHHYVPHFRPGQRGEYVQVRVHISDGTAVRTRRRGARISGRPFCQDG